MEKDKQSQTIDQDQQTDQNEIISVASIDSSEIIIENQERLSASNKNAQDDQLSESGEQEIIVVEQGNKQQPNENRQPSQKLSFDEATVFLRDLLKAYYINKYQSNILNKKVLKDKQTSTENCKNKSQDNLIDRRIIIGIIIALGIISFILIGCLYVKNNQYQQALHNLNLSYMKNLKKIQAKHDKVIRKNTYLIKLVEQAVNEEKRNCDFLDVFALIKSTFSSKRHQNIQEFCRAYYQYEQIENNQQTDQEQEIQNQKTNNQNSEQQRDSDQQQQEQKFDENQSDSDYWKVIDFILEDDGEEQMNSNEQQQEAKEEDKQDYRFKYQKLREYEGDQEQQQNNNSNDQNFFNNFFPELYEYSKKIASYLYQKAKQFYKSAHNQYKNQFNQNENENDNQKKDDKSEPNRNSNGQQQEANEEDKQDNHEQNEKDNHIFSNYSFKYQKQRKYEGDQEQQQNSNSNDQNFFSGFSASDFFQKAKQYYKSAHNKFNEFKNKFYQNENDNQKKDDKSEPNCRFYKNSESGDWRFQNNYKNNNQKKDDTSSSKILKSIFQFYKEENFNQNMNEE
ncbi:hypothetical protein ABPG72_008669 [Tetrahymena utriculariae]